MIRLMISRGVLLPCALLASSLVFAAPPTSAPSLIHDRRSVAAKDSNAGDAEAIAADERAPVVFTAKFAEDVRAEQKIRRALQKSVPIHCVNRPLPEVLTAFFAHLGVPWLLDENALLAAGLKLDTPVTFNSVTGGAARGSLDALLKTLDLRWTYFHDSLLVTSAEESYNMLYIRVYPVADLVLTGSVRTRSGREVLRSGGSRIDYDPLLTLIKSTVSPSTWDDVGGSGSAQGFDPSLAIVFSQTREVHEQVELLLAALRDSRAAQQVALIEELSVGDQQATDPVERNHPTIRQRAKSKAIAPWQIPRTK